MLPGASTSSENNELQAGPWEDALPPGFGQACADNLQSLARLAAWLLGMKLGLVMLYDAEREGFRCTAPDFPGLIPRGHVFCGTALRLHAAEGGPALLVVPDARLDPRFAMLPVVQGEQGLRSYTGVTLSGPDGQAAGTLCVLGHQPHRPSEAQLDILRQIAAAASLQLTLHGRLEQVVLAAGQDREHARFLGAFRLAQERALHAQALRSRDAEMRAAVDALALALLRVDAEGAILLANRSCAAVLELPPRCLAAGAGLAAAVALCGPRAPLGRLSARLDGLLRSRHATRFQMQTENGRSLAVNWQPMPDGGWMATFDDVTRQREAERRLRHLAGHDTLTGLPNREHFQDRLRQALAAPGSGAVAVLCLDIDRFRAVNESLGYPQGDALLRLVTARLCRRLPPGLLLARLGADEFGLLQVGAAQPQGARLLAQDLGAWLAEPFHLDDRPLLVTAAVGASWARSGVESPSCLMKQAGLALHRARQQGRGRCCFYDPHADDQAQLQRQLEMDLLRALQEEQFLLHYQPLVSLEGQGISGFEALVRWQHPQRGLVPPDAFIPLAEETEMVIPLGQLVLQRACAEAAAWPAPVRVAVNLSPMQFYSPDLPWMVAQALAASGLPAERLELEITEAVLLHDSENTLSVLHRLRALGTRIVLDDFGTGYSSLSYLRSFPFDKLKIDRSFVGDIESNRGSAAVVRAVTGLCAELGMTITAEGVETEAQLALLRAQRCTEVQGYLFSPPVPPAGVPALLRRFGAAGGPPWT